MKKLLIYFLFIGLPMSFSSCGYYGDYAEPRNDSPNMPTSYNGRPVVDQGDINTTSRDVTFYVWDSGNLVDGDMITLVVNGREVLSSYTLTGSKHSVSVTLENLGYNYVLLYAHNVGSSPPNTCALSVDDGTGEQSVVLSADLQTNGAMDIIVE